MARRQYKRLTAAAVNKLASQPGSHPDGDGLYLQIGKTGVANWVYRYFVGIDEATGRKRERFMGLGPPRRIGLAEARRLAEEARRLRDDGVDPIHARRSKQTERKLKSARAMSFRQCAQAYIDAHASWCVKARFVPW